jgi:phage terminase large subunit-like protein
MQSEGPAIVEFLARFCRHPRGSEAGQPVMLVPEQQKVLTDMFAIEDGRWKHREALIMVHRKWAKTLIGSGISLYGLTTRGIGTEIYFAANSRTQAGILKRNVDAFAMSSKALRKRLYVFRNKIETPLGSYMMTLGADAHQAHGYNPFISLIDEYWAFRSNDLPEALSSGAAARDESMTIYITTPGINFMSPLGLLVERAERADPTLFVHWPGRDIPADVDPFDHAAWREYNLGYRHGWISQHFLESQANSLERSEFVRLHLGGWLKRSAGWMNMNVWDKLVDDTPLEPQTPMVLFLDGAWKHDSVALVAVTLEDVPTVRVIRIWEKPMRDAMWRVPYSELNMVVRETIATHKVKQIGADPFFLGQLLQEWADDGIPIVEVPTNSVSRAVQATKRFEDAVMDGRLRQDGNATLRRHIQNCVPKQDHHGLRITRDRGNPVGYIDAAIGAVFGYDMASKVKQEPSLWMY